MYTYLLILEAENEDKAYQKASSIAGGFGRQFNISAAVAYESDPKFFESNSELMIKMYDGLKQSSTEMIEKFQGKLKEDDFLLKQLQDNLIRYGKHSYTYPEEWKIVYFDGTEFNHIDEKSYFNEILSTANKEKLHVLVIDVE